MPKAKRSSGKPQRKPVPPAPAPAMTYGQIGVKVGLTAAAIGHKIKRGMSVDQILEEGERRRLAREAGTLKGKDKLAGVPKSFYAARKQAAVDSTPVPKAGAGQSPSMPMQRASAAASPNEELHSAATRKEIALANLKEIEEQQKRGELIGTEYVKAYMGSCIIRAREVWMGIRDLSDRIRQEPDAIKAQQIIDEEVRRGLGELEKFGEMLVQKAKGGVANAEAA